MTEDHRLSKVEILIQQHNYSEAENILKTMLSEDPDNVHYLVLFAEVKLQQEQTEEATEIINNAIGIAPDIPHLFYTKSRIAIQKNDLAEAEKWINQSITLDPYDADFFALLSSIKLGRKKFQEALDAADRALEIDSKNIYALNARSAALNKLKRGKESFETVEGALREDPNNAYTHANYGWGLLEQGNYKKALEHFKESLKNDPNDEYAQAGMLEALKASNPIYRGFLKYSFWIHNMGAKYQWGFVIGFYVGFRILKNLARSNEALQPFLMPIIIVLAVIAFSTWVIRPISNLFLRLNKYGKMLLDEKEKASSNFVALSFTAFVISIVLFMILKDETYLTLAAFGFAMMLPYSVMFSPSKYKNSLIYYAIIMTVIGLISVGISFSGGEIINTMSVLFIFGFVGFQWVANFLLIQESNQ